MRNFLPLLTLIAASGLSLWAQADRVPQGTEITVRTNQSIDARSPADSRIYTGVVERDVVAPNGDVVIPRGSDAELILRDVASDSVVLDLESVRVNGRRYVVSASDQSVDTEGHRKEGVGANRRTGKYVGGGAVLGTIIGAIAGGGRGAAIGAAAGAGAGAVGQTVTRGRNFRLPAESLVTFRLDQPLMVGGTDDGYTRDGYHYHRRDRYDRNDADRERRDR